MALTVIVTNAGRAALVNAANTGTAPVTIAQVGLSATVVTPVKTATTLPGEFKRIATLSGDVVADDTIHLIVRDETTQVFTVRSIALYLADGTLFAIYGQAATIIEKSAQAMMLLAIDVQFADVAATLLTFGNANFLNPPATTAQIGVVELATLPEAIAGTDTARVPAAKIIKDAVTSWLDSRFGANNAGIWHPGNDGGGSGLDADLLDGQQGSYYSNITARLGYTPVQQGTGNGQYPNNVKIGWNNAGRLKVTVDSADLGNVVFDSNITDVWRSSNDGSGSGLDADLLDGQQGSYYSDIVARLGYTPISVAGGTFTGQVVMGGQSPWLVFSESDTGKQWHMILDGSSLSIREDSSSGANSRLILSPGSAGLTLGANLTWGNDTVWHTGNDGSGSGLDADMLDGQHGSYYADVPARLGYTPIQQGGGSGQGTNKIYIGWATGRLKCQVDSTDRGNFVFDSNITDVWRSSNDGSGSGLDADLLDGQQGSYYSDIVARLGYTPISVAGGTFTGQVVMGGQSPWLVFSESDTGKQWHMILDGSSLSIREDSSSGANSRLILSPGSAGLTLGANLTWGNDTVWHTGNDGSGSGLDADMLDGQHGSYYADVPARLGYTPIQQGGGSGQGTNKIYIGWAAGRLKCQVDSTDRGNFVFDSNITDVWRSSNDGSGSGLDADLLDGFQASAFLRDVGSSIAQNGYMKLSNGLILQWGSIAGTFTAGADNSVTYPVAFPNATLNLVGANSDVAAQGSAVVGFNYSPAPGPTGFKFRTSVTGQNRLNWLAIGN